MTVFLAGAWLGAYHAPLFAGRYADCWIFSTFGPVSELVANLTFALLQLLRRAVLFVVPALAAVGTLRKRERLRSSWLEWNGLGPAAALFLIAEATELFRSYFVSNGSASSVGETLVRAITLLASMLMGIVLVRVWRQNRQD